MKKKESEIYFPKGNLLLLKKILVFGIFLLFGLTAEAQQLTVAGTVTDENGNPLPGVNMMVERTTIGTISDINGKYTLNVPDRNGVLVFTFVGYSSQKIPVEGRAVIDVQMKPDVKSLEEVVVVGYGVQRKGKPYRSR